MNEVDKLYHEWRENQRSHAKEFFDLWRAGQGRWATDYDEDKIRYDAVNATTKQLNEYINTHRDDNSTLARIQSMAAYDELDKRRRKYEELAAKIRKTQLVTRGNLAETLENQNKMNNGSLKEELNERLKQKETIKTKGRKTMAQTTKTVKVNTKIDVAALVQAKMAEKMMDAVGDGKDIPLTKLTIMQSLANGGSIDVNELIRAKQTEKLLKDLNENKDLSIGKLLTYQALTNEDGFDVNALIQAQFVEKLFDEDKK